MKIYQLARSAWQCRNPLPDFVNRRLQLSRGVASSEGRRAGISGVASSEGRREGIRDVASSMTRVNVFSRPWSTIDRTPNCWDRGNQTPPRAILRFGYASITTALTQSYRRPLSLTRWLAGTITLRPTWTYQSVPSLLAHRKKKNISTPARLQS